MTLVDEDIKLRKKPSSEIDKIKIQSNKYWKLHKDILRDAFAIEFKTYYSELQTLISRCAVPSVIDTEVKTSDSVQTGNYQSVEQVMMPVDDIAELRLSDNEDDDYEEDDSEDAFK